MFMGSYLKVTCTISCRAISNAIKSAIRINNYANKHDEQHLQTKNKTTIGTIHHELYCSWYNKI